MTFHSENSAHTFLQLLELFAWNGSEESVAAGNDDSGILSIVLVPFKVMPDTVMCPSVKENAL